jgi:mitogen-activated protein kinase 1/3
MSELENETNDSSLQNHNEYSFYDKKACDPKIQITKRLVNSRPIREKNPRQLSPHVASRWYRAPELIVMERNYTNRSDLWSVGCILGELMAFSDEMSGVGRDIEKRILFPGMNCFPVSPCQ